MEAKSDIKYRRQEAIKDIIKNFNVETQDELIERLKLRGFEATQATISRDLRQLHLTKVPSGIRSSKYAMPARNTVYEPAKYYSILRGTVTHVDTAQNLIVIKTMPGMAQAAAAAVDEMDWSEIIGCIAGDDTIFLATKSYEKAAEYAELLKRYMNMNFYENNDF